MKPSQKTAGMEAALEALFGVDRQSAIRSNRCIDSPIGCGMPVDGFRDELSAKEFTISGLCQKCQDSAFDEMHTNF